MVERGRAVYDIFLSKGFTLNSKKLANELHNARNKRSKKMRLDGKQKHLLKICKEIEINPRTVRTWLEVISVEK